MGILNSSAVFMISSTKVLPIIRSNNKGFIRFYKQFVRALHLFLLGRKSFLKNIDNPLWISSETMARPANALPVLIMA